MTAVARTKISECIIVENSEDVTRICVMADSDNKLFGVFVGLGCIYSFYIAMLTLRMVLIRQTGIDTAGAIFFVFSFIFMITILFFGALCYTFGSEVITVTQEQLKVQLRLGRFDISHGRSFEAAAVSNMRGGERLLRGTAGTTSRKPIIVFDYKNGMHEFFSRFSQKERADLFAGPLARFAAKSK